MSTIDTHTGGSSATAAAPSKKTSFIPLEANPELMTALLGQLGLSPALALHDVYSLTDPALLSFVPRPALALLLVFPVSAAYESHRLAEDALLPAYAGPAGGGGGETEMTTQKAEEEEPVLWFPQTIRNACGLMGLLHAAANGEARGFVREGSELARLIAAAAPLGPAGRAALLERDEALARAHREVAERGDTAAPDAAQEVDLHYVCFVKGADGGLWEMDGRRKGPLRRGDLEAGEDVLSEKALTLGPRKFLEREAADLRFSCLALAASLE